MVKIDITYHKLLNEILTNGYWYDDSNREGVKRLEIPSYTFRHEFKDGFPILTTKKLNYKNVVTELIWFLRGDTNITYLLENNCNIWNKDCLKHVRKHFGNRMSEEKLIKRVLEDNNRYYGNLGPIYGYQWRKWSTYHKYGDKKYTNGIEIDQITNLIKNLKEKPLATDHIVNSWNVSDLPAMALPPCHYAFQIVVRPLKVFFKDEEVNIKKYGFELHWSQRSVDTFLGLPYNIASYATLALIIEKLTGYKALGIQGDLKKVHLYDNSIEGVKEQLSRDVNKYESGVFDFPIFEELTWNNLDELFNKLLPCDITIENYESYPHIKVDMLERNK